MRRLVGIVVLMNVFVLAPAEAVPLNERMGYLWPVEVAADVTLNVILLERDDWSFAGVVLIDHAAEVEATAWGPAEVALDTLAEVGWAEFSLPTEIRAYAPHAEEQGPVLGHGQVTVSMRLLGYGSPGSSGGCACVFGPATGIRRSAHAWGTVRTDGDLAGSFTAADAFLASDVGL